MGKSENGSSAKKWKIWRESDVQQYLRAPSPKDDKYSRGVLGVIAGSRQYPGAAILVCRAALHTGIGMVRFSGSARLRSLVLRSTPEVVTQQGQVQAWVIGPGIDQKKIGRRRRRSISSALEDGVPTLLDAGGLSFLDLPSQQRLATPHFRELSKAFATRGVTVTPSAIESDPKRWAIKAAEEFGATVLLKGSVTVIASENSLIQLESATPWLATAGSGDVLAGIIGALIATNYASSSAHRSRPNFLPEIAATGAFIHAQAAARASQGGPISASDIIDEIPKVMADFIL